MRGMNSLPLDDDIVDCVLTSLPDYATLRAIILSSKSFYNVFKTHPKSIIRSISYNIVGPSLPQAIRLIRYKGASHSHSHIKPWSEDDDIGCITGEECRRLATNATVAKALEDLFSFRHKDRTSHTSVLNSTESLRFQRAMYRLMLIARVFPARNYDYYDEEDEDYDPASVERDRLARKELLDDFATSELFELHSTALFLIEIVQGICAGQNQPPGVSGYGDEMLAFGPPTILEAYQLATVQDLDDFGDFIPACLVDYIFNPLKKIWEERKAKPPPDNSADFTSLLDDIRGGDKCGVTCGLDLWNESSWDDLRRLSESFSVGAIGALVKGHLLANIVEGPSLRNKLLGALTYSSPMYTNLLEQMHKVKTIPPWDTWNKGDWLCEPCIVELIRAHLHLWLLEWKRERGDEIKEDCWYGYNCRTQRHNAHHAGRLNHFCEPTR